MKLKKQTVQNYLTMVPVKNVKEFTETDGKIILLLPKFKNEKFGRWFIPRRKSAHFRIHLDDLGSKVWIEIDGNKSVDEICQSLESQFSKDSEQVNQLEERITKFLTELYKSRFITFR